MSVWSARSASIENARLKATRLLARFGVESVEHIDVESFATRLGADLEVAPLDGARAQLIHWADSERARIVVSDRVLDCAERRYAIAHELGHLVLKHPSVPARDLGEAPPQGRTQSTIEAEADAFARELLIPSSILRTLTPPRAMTLDIAERLASMFRTTLVASAMRLTETTHRVCAVLMSRSGAIQWSAPSEAFLHVFRRSRSRLTEGARLDARSHAYSIERSASSVARKVSPLAWLTLADCSSQLIEQSICIGPPGQVLTMLWAPDRDPRASRAASLASTHMLVDEDAPTVKRVAAPRVAR